MNWTTIAVVYADDPYGFYFFTGIKRLAEDTGIDVKISISVTYEIDPADDILSYEAAATKIVDSEVFIIIAIIHQSSNFWQVFYEHGLMQYPYYIRMFSYLLSNEITLIFSMILSTNMIACFSMYIHSGC